MGQFVDMTGIRVGRLTAISRASDRNGTVYWICRCDCGKLKEVPGVQLRRKRAPTLSCGCLAREIARASGKKVGLLPKKKKHGLCNTPEHNTWFNIKARCSLERKLPVYKRYWGRGIKVCDRWLESFENFYADMGPRPSPKHSIDRIDNNGHYEPSNCRWATATEQARNKSTTVLFTLNGITKTMGEWSMSLENGRPNTVKERLNRGWSVKDAITLPATRRKKND